MANTASLFNISLQADLEHFGEVGSLDENVESFLSQDDGDIRDGLFGTIKPSPTEHNMDVSNGNLYLKCDKVCVDVLQDMELWMKI
jgi:hypothetical protein